MNKNNKPLFELLAYSGGILCVISSLLSLFISFLNVILGLIGFLLIVVGIIGIVIGTISKFNKIRLLFGIVNISLVIAIALLSSPAMQLGHHLYFIVNKNNLEKRFEIESKKLNQFKFYRGGCFNDSMFTAIELYGMLDTRYGFVKIKNGIIDSETRKRMGRMATYLQKVGNNWYYYNTGN